MIASRATSPAPTIVSHSLRTSCPQPSSTNDVAHRHRRAHHHATHHSTYSKPRRAGIALGSTAMSGLEQRHQHGVLVQRSERIHSHTRAKENIRDTVQPSSFQSIPIASGVVVIRFRTSSVRRRAVATSMLSSQDRLRRVRRLGLSYMHPRHGAIRVHLRVRLRLAKLLVDAPHPLHERVPV